MNGIASMYRKSLAADVSVNWIVNGFGVAMPLIACVFWKFVMFAAVGGCAFAFAK